MSVCLIIGEVNLESVVKVVPVRFLHCNGLFFLLQIIILGELF